MNYLTLLTLLLLFRFILVRKQAIKQIVALPIMHFTITILWLGAIGTRVRVLACHQIATNRQLNLHATKHATEMVLGAIGTIHQQFLWIQLVWIVVVLLMQQETLM